jgi:hypothetical protein
MQHITAKQKNMLALLILWLFKDTELQTPKIRNYSTAKEQIVEFLHGKVWSFIIIGFDVYQNF